jgi:hemerythrin-like domain-containing protein
MSAQVPTPVDNFSDCHAGIVTTLKKLNHLPELVLQAQNARETAQSVLKLFEEVVYQHHTEEEQDLFTAVFTSSQPGPERDRVQAMTRQLTAEHRAIEAAWSDIKTQVKSAAKGNASTLPEKSVQLLVSQYLAHAGFEEQHFLPLAQEILGRNSNHMAALGMTLHMRHAKIPVAYM